MSRVADYIVVRNPVYHVPGIITDPASQIFRFTVPPNTALARRALLSFQLRSISGEVDLTLSISINGTQVFTRPLHAPQTYDFTIQEALPTNLLVLGDNANNIVFTRTNVVGGPLAVSDIIVWFRVDSNLMRTIQMNDHGDIFAGGEGEDGDLVLRSTGGAGRIRLDAGSANAWIGGNGAGGDLILFRTDGDNHTLSEATVHLSGQQGEVRVGSNGTSGDLFLFPSHVAGINSPSTQASVQLQGDNARLIVGGGGAGEVAASRDGEILVRGGSPEGNRITLSGEDAQVRVGGFGADANLILRSQTNENRILLDAANASIAVGGNTVAQATIHLDGATGDIRANGNVSAANFFAGAIQLNVPDYVWESNYALMPLAELRAYTAREKRLPNMPSAAEIKREGLNLSQFQMQLLEKIEELTRYLLTQQETIQAQQAQIDALGSQLKQLAQGQH